MGEAGVDLVEVLLPDLNIKWHARRATCDRGVVVKRELQAGLNVEYAAGAYKLFSKAGQLKGRKTCRSRISIHLHLEMTKRVSLTC